MITIAELKLKPKEELFALGCRWWDGKLMLITPSLFNELSNGEKLVCIDNFIYVKGKDDIDQDTRGDLLAFGFIPANLEDEDEE